MHIVLWIMQHACVLFFESIDRYFFGHEAEYNKRWVESFIIPLLPSRFKIFTLTSTSHIVISNRLMNKRALRYVWRGGTMEWKSNPDSNNKLFEIVDMIMADIGPLLRVMSARPNLVTNITRIFSNERKNMDESIFLTIFYRMNAKCVVFISRIIGQKAKSHRLDMKKKSRLRKVSKNVRPKLHQWDECEWRWKNMRSKRIILWDCQSEH